MSRTQLDCEILVSPHLIQVTKIVSKNEYSFYNETALSVNAFYTGDILYVEFMAIKYIVK